MSTGWETTQNKSLLTSSWGSKTSNAWLCPKWLIGTWARAPSPPPYFTLFAVARSDLQSVKEPRYLSLTSDGGKRKGKNECWMLLGCEVSTRKRPPTHSFGKLSLPLNAAPLFLCIKKYTEREGEERVRQAPWEGEENLKWIFRMQAVGWWVWLRGAVRVNEMKVFPCRKWKEIWAMILTGQVVSPQSCHTRKTQDEMQRWATSRRDNNLFFCVRG